MFKQRLKSIVGPQPLLDAPDELVVYECDGYVVEKNSPDIVVFPVNSDEVVRIVRECNQFGVPFVARGAGNQPGRWMPARRWRRHDCSGQNESHSGNQSTRSLRRR